MFGDTRALMRVAALLAHVSLLWSSVANAQSRIDVSGYVVDFPLFQNGGHPANDIADSSGGQFLNLTRLRLRPSLLLWDGAKISLEYEADALYGTERVAAVQTSEPTSTQLYSMRWSLLSGAHGRLEHSLDRLFFRQNFPGASLVIGRQRIAWGTGRIWNPTDLFNPISPADFEKLEKDGADAASFKYYFGNFSDAELVLNPVDKFSKANAAIRILTNVAGYDVSAMTASMNERTVVGADVAGNLLQAGIRGEGIYSMPQGESGDAFVRFIVGADYQLTPQLYSLLEYLWNGEGESNDSLYDLHQISSGQTIAPGRSYLFFNTVYRFHPLISLSVSADFNLIDGSWFSTPVISYALADYATLDLGVFASFGNNLTEFWYYPSSCYLKMQFYF